MRHCAHEIALGAMMRRLDKIDRLLVRIVMWMHRTAQQAIGALIDRKDRTAIGKRLMREMKDLTIGNLERGKKRLGLNGSKRHTVERQRKMRAGFMTPLHA